MTTIDADETNVDSELLRPADWNEFVGQHVAKAELEVAIDGALERHAMIGHVLLAGRPGLGKTSLAGIIAERLGEPFESVSMAGMTPNAMTRLFRTFPTGILLLDEIHAATKPIQDMLLTLLEDGWMTAPSGARLCTGWLAIVGATTEKRRLDPALRQRFEHQPRFVDYTDDEMRRIVVGMATKLEVEVDEDMVDAVARAAGGTPRNARHLMLKTRDLQASRRRHDEDPPTPTDVLRLAGVDINGVSDDHVDYLAAIDKNGGVAGLDTLKMRLSLHESDIRELERFLLEKSLITYTNSGRELTAAGARKLREHRARPAA